MSDFENEETKVVYRNNFFGTLITLIIGLILGIVLTVGGVIGTGYWAITQPLNTTVTKVDDLVEADVYTMLFGSEEGKGILSDTYAEKTVKDLLADITNAASKLTADGGSLKNLNDVSPQVSVMLEKLVSKLDEYAITLDADELLKKPFKSSDKEAETFAQYLSAAIQNTAIGDLFSKFSDEPLSDLLLVLCYGEKDVDYTVDAEGKIQMLGDSKKTTLRDLTSGDMMTLLASVPVDAVIDIDLNDDVMCAIAYGTSDHVYLGEDGKAKMHQVVYTAKDGKFYTDKNEAVVADLKYLNTEGTLIELTISTGETDDDGNPINEVQYASIKSGKWYVYKDAELTAPLLYEKVKIGDLQGDAMAIIDNVYLKDALGITNANTTHNVLISLAYGEENVNYTIESDGTIKSITTPRTIGELRLRGGDLINDIALSDIMGEDRSQAIVMYLLYGRKDVHYTITGDAVEMLQKRIAVIGDKAYNEYGEALGGTVTESTRTYVDANGVTYKYGNTAIDTVATADGDANVYYLFDASGNVLKYKKTSLGDLTGSDNLISRISTRLTIGEIVEIDESGNSLLKHVKNETIESLPTAIENLTIQQVFEDKIFKTDGAGNKVVTGSWWYLLHSETDCQANGHTNPASCSCVSDYNLQGMDKLIDNMKNNIHLSTLNKLSADGMLNFGDGMLGSKIFTEISAAGHTFYIKVRVPDENGDYPATANTLASVAFAGKNTLGELTVEETIEYAEGLIKVVEQIDAIL